MNAPEIKRDLSGRLHRDPDPFVMTEAHFRMFIALDARIKAEALEHPDVLADDSVELPERFDADFDGGAK